MTSARPSSSASAAQQEAAQQEAAQQEAAAQAAAAQAAAAQRPVDLDRYLVPLQLTTDAVLGGVLLTVGLLGPGNRGPRWLWLTVGSLLLATTTILFLRFSFLCWSRSPDPQPPLGPEGQGKEHRGVRTITALLSATVGIILGYTLLYCDPHHRPTRFLRCRRHAGDRQSAGTEDHHRESAAGISGTY